jgi:hypothetical protein
MFMVSFSVIWFENVMPVWLAGKAVNMGLSQLVSNRPQASKRKGVFRSIGIKSRKDVLTKIKKEGPATTPGLLQ